MASWAGVTGEAAAARARSTAATRSASGLGQSSFALEALVLAFVAVVGMLRPAACSGRGDLVVGAEVAHSAGGFFGGAGGVEGDEAGEDFGVGQVGFGATVAEPAVGGGDRGIEFVVELAEDGDEAGVVVAVSLGVRARPARRASRTLYIAVSERPGCCACTRLRCASSSSPKARMRAFAASSHAGKGQTKRGVLARRRRQR